MRQFSYKYKIILLVVGWLALAGLLFGYIFGILSQGSQNKVTEIIAKKKEVMDLQAEQRSYQLAKNDLDQLASKDLQPDDFFSRDTSLVNEVRELESLAERNNLEINFGLAGMATSLGKAKTSAELLIAPYTMNLEGQFSNVVTFLQSVEYLSFITHLKTVSVSSTSGGEVNASFSSVFYLKK